MDTVQIGIKGAPQTRIRDSPDLGYRDGRAGGHQSILVPGQDNASVGIGEDVRHRERPDNAVVIRNQGPERYIGGVGADVRRSDVDAARSVIGRRDVIRARGDVPGFAVDAPVALEQTRSAVGQAIAASAVADLDGEDVVTAKVDRAGCVEDESRISTPMLPKSLAIDIDIRDLKHAFEIDVDASAGGGIGN